MQTKERKQKETSLGAGHLKKGEKKTRPFEAEGALA